MIDFMSRVYFYMTWLLPFDVILSFVYINDIQTATKCGTDRGIAMKKRASSFTDCEYYFGKIFYHRDTIRSNAIIECHVSIFFLHTLVVESQITMCYILYHKVAIICRLTGQTDDPADRKWFR